VKLLDKGKKEEQQEEEQQEEKQQQQQQQQEQEQEEGEWSSPLEIESVMVFTLGLLGDPQLSLFDRAAAVVARGPGRWRVTHGDVMLAIGLRHFLALG